MKKKWKKESKAEGMKEKVECLYVTLMLARAHPFLSFFLFALLKRKGRGTHHLFLEGIYSVWSLSHPACCAHLHFLGFYTLHWFPCPLSTPISHPHFFIFLQLKHYLFLVFFYTKLMLTTKVSVFIFLQKIYYVLVNNQKEHFRVLVNFDLFLMPYNCTIFILDYRGH